MLNSEVKFGKSFRKEVYGSVHDILQYFTGSMFKSFFDSAVCSETVGLFFIQRSGTVWEILVEGLMRNIIFTFV